MIQPCHSGQPWYTMLPNTCPPWYSHVTAANHGTPCYQTPAHHDTAMSQRPTMVHHVTKHWSTMIQRPTMVHPCGCHSGQPWYTMSPNTGQPWYTQSHTGQPWHYLIHQIILKQLQIIMPIQSCCTNAKTNDIPIEADHMKYDDQVTPFLLVNHNKNIQTL